MKKDITSEEKLLNLIRKKSPESQKEKIRKSEGNPPAVHPSTIGNPSNFPRILTRGLLVVCLGLMFYIISHVFLLKPSGDDLLSLEARDASDDVPISEDVLPPSKPFNDYAQTIDQRDLFMSVFQRTQVQAAAPAQPEAVPPQPAVDLSQNFKLVGIILDSDPKAIVEDLKNQKTLFLSHGDQLDGAVLKEIRDGKAVFTINEQSVELVP